MVENTPIDYLHFCQPGYLFGQQNGIGYNQQVGRWKPRYWATTIEMDEVIKRRVNELWGKLEW